VEVVALFLLQTRRNTEQVVRSDMVMYIFPPAERTPLNSRPFPPLGLIPLAAILVPSWFRNPSKVMQQRNVELRVCRTKMAANKANGPGEV